MDRKVQVIGYANRLNSYSQNWENSLRKSWFEYQIIGIGEKWTGLAVRINAYLKFLQQTPADDTIYIFTDVYDFLAVGDKDEFIRKWQNYETSIVIGAEPNCNHNLCRPIRNYPKSKYKGSDKYLNFGMVAGTRSPLIHFMSWLVEDSEKYPDDIWNEQIASSRYIDSHTGQISLDHSMDLVGNIISHPWNGNKYLFQLRNGRVKYYQTGCYSVFIHTPSKGIDGLARYQKYGCLILGEKWIQPFWFDRLSTPGYHWLRISLVVIIVSIIFLISDDRNPFIFWLFIIIIVAFAFNSTFSCFI